MLLSRCPLNPAPLSIQPPGAVHLVYNITPGVAHGGHFLTWETLSSTRISRWMEGLDSSMDVTNHEHPAMNYILGCMAISLVDFGEPPRESQIAICLDLTAVLLNLQSQGRSRGKSQGQSHQNDHRQSAGSHRRPPFAMATQTLPVIPHPPSQIFSVCLRVNGPKGQSPQVQPYHALPHARPGSPGDH